jgi:hypothetical protein
MSNGSLNFERTATPVKFDHRPERAEREAEGKDRRLARRNSRQKAARLRHAAERAHAKDLGE